MSVIIRLQNLPWSANALDIRQFFHGLSIPEGGVHIVGGELGDAFIAFSTDEDARQAFNLNNGKIKEIQIKLMLSSRTEMQKVIEAARNQSYTAFMRTAPTPLLPNVPQVMPAVVPAAVPELKKDIKNEKRDKRRSRSRSRERKDRERDRDRRDRRRRDRTRSRSRDRRDRRRREHSPRDRTRDRTRSKERDIRVKDVRNEKVAPNLSSNNVPKEPKVGVWESPRPNDIQPSIPPPPQQPPSLLSSFPLTTPSLLDDRNGFTNQGNSFNGRWSQSQNSNASDGSLDGHGNFSSRQRFQTHEDSRYIEPSHNRGRISNDQYNHFENPRTLFNRPVLNRPDNLNPRYDERQERSQERIPQEICKDCCIKMRPYYGGFGEVRRFFQGIFIHNTGIKFVNDDYGKRTGIVYIRFAYPDGKEEALTRNGQLLKNQVVEIEHLDDEVFDETVDRYQPEHMQYEDEQESDSSRFRGKNITKYFNKNASNNQSNQSLPPKVFSCLVVEDLPTYAKEQDILKMFSEYPLMSIIIVNKPRKSHAAYVQFSNSDDAKTAQQETTKHVVDGKHVTVKPCRDELFETVQREQSEIPEDKSSEDKQNDYANSECIYLSRLPLKTTIRDVSDFFSDIGIIPKEIHLLHNSMGFSGEAFCEFISIDDANAALDKNGMPMGTSNIIVKSAERSEMINTLGMQVNKRPIQSLLHLRPNIGMNIQPRPFFPRSNFTSPNLRGLNFMGPRPRRFPPHHHQNAGDEPFGPPGCTVIMENVPYKATAEEILEFFKDFDIPSDNILRRYNPNGKPSGESKVIFKDPDDAYQAVNQKQEHKIRDRTIYLSLY